MDIMIDIETLSKRNNAVIVSVGAVLFNPRNGGLGESIYIALDWHQQIMQRRHISKKTLKWWDEQKEDAPQGSGKVGMLFGKLATLFEVSSEVIYVWFRGPDFDKVKLEHLARQFGHKVPWTYKQVRDSRTLDIFGVKRERSEPTHNALDDAKEQALDVIYILDRVRDVGLPAGPPLPA